MKYLKGFTLIEVLIVIVIIAILSSISLISYHKYLKNAVKTHLISDIRHCLQEIAINIQAGESDIPSIVSGCATSEYTESLELVNTNPIEIKATGRILIDEVSCSYNDSTGVIQCDFD